MSKINIQGTINNIRSKSNVYTPIIEGIVNSIDSIKTGNVPDGKITLIVKRENQIQFDNALPSIKSLEIHDNGIGFNSENRNSFDTLYSEKKIKSGGKGFGRFMYLKYFQEARIESIYKEENGTFYKRKFHFGTKDEIIVGETDSVTEENQLHTVLFLNNLHKNKSFDKELETIARKVLEKLLIFFTNDQDPCPEIILQEGSDSSKKIILNEYLEKADGIAKFGTVPFVVKNDVTNNDENFLARVFKVYYSTENSKVILTADNREVTESALHAFIPEFEDQFYDDIEDDFKVVTKNYILKTYVIGKYLNENVSLERETFNLPKDGGTDAFGLLSQSEIEKAAAIATTTLFQSEVKLRAENKRQRIHDYVNSNAPWHKTYINHVDFSNFSYNTSPERIELELQKYKFHQEQETKSDVWLLLNSTEDEEFDARVDAVMTKVTEMGKSDLAHYVSTRKVVLEIFDEMRKRDEKGNAILERDIHSLIYPMNRDSTNTAYQEHNLWLLDERLVFSQYVASDRKISSDKKNEALDEPDLVVFDVKNSYRSGENEFSNPLTIFEFKRPKRTNYTEADDPVLQIGRYLNKIRDGKYEMPDGTEPIKVNENTPVYAYIVCDLVQKIHDVAQQYGLTVSADKEGYFGFHPGFKMYLEIISFKKLLKDASLRNKIFFKKLNLI